MRRLSAFALAAVAVLAACDGGTEPDPELTITSISPALLEPGVTMVIEGTGFATTPSRNQVTLSGLPLDVASATSTELRIELDAGSFPCAATGDAEVVVSVAEREASTQHPIDGSAISRTLQVGEFIRLVGDGRVCNELTEPGRYLITVYNTSTTPDATTAFRLRGAALSAATDAGLAGIRAPEIRIDPPLRPIAPNPDALAHLRTLDRSIELVERLGTRGGRSMGAPTTAASRATMAAPALGSIRSFRIPDIDAESACASFIDVDARVVYAGSRGVIYEDTAASLAGTMDSHWQQLGDEFDTVMYPILLEYFGDPLVYDDQLDDDDRLLMLFSEQVNDLEDNVAGFVFSGDLFPRTGTGNQQGCASSDLAEIFYGIVPTEAGSGFDSENPSDNPDRWLRSIRSTVIHEVKHITSFAHRFANDANFLEDGWLEESTARISEELYAREIFGYGQSGNIGYQQSIYCEVRPTWDDCTGTPYVMAKHFDAVVAYYESMESLSPIGPAVEDDWTYYGSGWLLVRWAIDQTGGSEADFLKALINETISRGVGNLAARTGRSFPEMLADFSLAAALDDRPGVAAGRAELSFPSWDTRDIFAGFNTDFPDNFSDATPLDPRSLAYGAFDLTVAELAGGSASVFELAGTSQGPQTIQLQAEAGGTPPSSLGIALVRVQ